MAITKHLDIIKQGRETWNWWRSENPDVRLDLSAADFRGRNLSLLNFDGADLTSSNLSRANLIGANLKGANLSYADFHNAVLDQANLTRANLIGTNLIKARLVSAKLLGTDFIDADLREADCSFADLRGAILNDAKLNGLQLAGAIMGHTTLGNNDLSVTHGLHSVRHFSPSSIGIDTIYRSHGNIPDIFLRGAGVPENLITYLSSLTGKAFEFYSCFISYSSKNQDLAERLYADLQSKGVRCWFAPEDLKIGDEMRLHIDESIRKHDKLLLILSKYSVASDWVKKEVETALEKERKEKRMVLFPIRLDDAVLKVQSGWAADIRRTRNIGDFRDWQIHDVYRKAFDRLLRNLNRA